MKKILALLVVSTVFAGSASALELNVLGGLNFANSSDSGPGYTGISSKAKAGITVGATVEFSLVPMFALEVGLFSNGNKKSVTSTLVNYDGSNRSLEIPLLLKFTGLPLAEFGAGLYYEKSPSNVTISNSTNTVLLANGDFDQSSTYETGDMGIKLDARLKLPLMPLTSILVDASYKMGLKDLDKASSDTSKTKSYALLVGAAIGF